MKILFLSILTILVSCSPQQNAVGSAPIPVIAVRPTDIPWTEIPIYIHSDETVRLIRDDGMAVSIHIFTQPADSVCPVHVWLWVEQHPEYVVPAQCPPIGTRTNMDEINGFSDNRFGMELQVLNDRVAVFFNTELWIAPP